MSVIGRSRESTWEAVPMPTALDLIERHCDQLNRSRVIHVHEARCGDVIAADFLSAVNVPELRSSIKDGYAVIASDGAGKRKVVGVSTAGHAFAGMMKSGECVRISTGAPVPDGADAVVMVERTALLEHDGNEELSIEIKEAPIVGADIRAPGSDVRVGDVLLYKGCTLSAAELGVMYGSGQRQVEVFDRTRVCVMSTGSELSEWNTNSTTPGIVRDTNRPQLLALFAANGFEPLDGGIAVDEHEILVAKLRAVFEKCDFVMTSGGVSMGEKDLLKSVLQNDFGFEIHFGRVWMKPGLPATFATGMYEGRKIKVFALPGNPVSSWVCAHLFVLPALRKVAGVANWHTTQITVELLENVRLDKRPEYRRATLCPSEGAGLPGAAITGNQISSRLSSVVSANLLLIFPGNAPERAVLEKGSHVQALVVGPI